MLAEPKLSIDYPPPYDSSLLNIESIKQNFDINNAKYALFGGAEYYAKGGWRDLLGIYSSSETAKEEGDKLYYNEELDWYHIVDLSIMPVSKESIIFSRKKAFSYNE